VSPERSPALRIGLFSIFPDLLEHYLDETLLGRARRQGLLELSCHDLREGADDAHRSVDDSPFGGGAGMVLAPEPTFAAIERADPPRPIYAMSPAGRPFSQRIAEELAATSGFSLLCGRYEGIDQRIIDGLCEGEISIGDYVLAGGELAALVVVESVCRLVPGVLGNDESSGEESFSHGLLEYPHYTRPAVFRGRSVPDVLRSGDHGKVAAWRHAASLDKTLRLRPDLIAGRGGLTSAEVQALVNHGYPLPASAVGPEPGDDPTAAAASTEERDQQ
jgi:tRNA (guanine37-N1)-methyltransferase